MGLSHLAVLALVLIVFLAQVVHWHIECPGSLEALKGEYGIVLGPLDAAFRLFGPGLQEVNCFAVFLIIIIIRSKTRHLP